MPTNAETLNRTLGEFHAYLETLTFIQIDPRLRSKFSLSDMVQKTLVEAWRELERFGALDEVGRKRLLRRMLVNNLLEEVARWKAQVRDARREQSLDAAADESSCRLRSWLATEDSSPSERLAGQEEDLRLLEALAKLDARQREVLILKQYHRWTLAQIAEHLGCTPGSVAGLQARGLKELRKHLPDRE